MARGDDDNLMNRLRQMSEEGIAGFFNEIMSNDKMRSSFGRAGERFMANKQSFDRNVDHHRSRARSSHCNYRLAPRPLDPSMERRGTRARRVGARRCDDYPA